MAFIPVTLRVGTDEATGGSTVEIVSTILDVRSGRVMWFGVVAGRPGPTTEFASVASVQEIEQALNSRPETVRTAHGLDLVHLGPARHEQAGGQRPGPQRREVDYPQGARSTRRIAGARGSFEPREYRVGLA